MNTFSGKGRFGLVAAFTVLLMPLLGIGNASAIEVNDQVTVVVPCAVTGNVTEGVPVITSP